MEIKPSNIVVECVISWERVFVLFRFVFFPNTELINDFCIENIFALKITLKYICSENIFALKITLKISLH